MRTSSLGIEQQIANGERVVRRATAEEREGYGIGSAAKAEHD